MLLIALGDNKLNDDDDDDDDDVDVIEFVYFATSCCSLSPPSLIVSEWSVLCNLSIDPITFSSCCKSN